MIDKNIYKKLKNKKILITGHTGFKGAYLSILLKYFNSKIYGYSLPAEKDSLFDKLNLSKLYEEEKLNDIRDYETLKKFIEKIKPDFIIHMAAQALVLTSYEYPKETYEVNVIGTVNLLESIRILQNKNKIDVKCIANITTDKVYLNEEKEDYAFKENDSLCGEDPYSNSKSCSELVTYSYKKSFFKNLNVLTFRAGNVIGGGDISKNRIIVDCYNAKKDNTNLILRNPDSIRPYQYVLEPLMIYLYLILYKCDNPNIDDSYNIGPDSNMCVKTKEIVRLFNKYWDCDLNKDLYDVKENKNKEMKFLRLDNSLLKNTISYEPLINIEEAVKLTVDVYKNVDTSYDIIINQIKYILENIM